MLRQRIVLLMPGASAGDGEMIAGGPCKAAMLLMMGVC